MLLSPVVLSGYMGELNTASPRAEGVASYEISMRKYEVLQCLSTFAFKCNSHYSFALTPWRRNISMVIMTNLCISVASSNSDLYGTSTSCIVSEKDF